MRGPVHFHIALATFAAFWPVCVHASPELNPARAKASSARMHELDFLIKQNTRFREPDLIDSDRIELRVQRSYGIGTAFDLDNSGRPEPVDVIRYAPSDPACYDLLVGPTLVFRRGKTTTINLRNELKLAEQPVLSWQPGCDPGNPADPWMEDAAADLFNTNLHTHGLHVSPRGNADNVFLDLAPQRSRRLEFTLRSDHSAGTFWYHPHRHGVNAYQITNGLAGALIVPGEPRADPASAPSRVDDLEDIPEIRAANQIPGLRGDFGRVMCIQQFRFKETNRRTADDKPIWIVDPADISDRKEARPQDNAGTIVEGILAKGAAGQPAESVDVLSTNGVRAPRIIMSRGGVERWRFIHAGIESPIRARWYEWENGRLEPAHDGAIQMKEVALDGIPTGYMDDASTLSLEPGCRSDVLIRVADDAKSGETYVLYTDETVPYDSIKLRNKARPQQTATQQPLPPAKIPPSALAVITVGRARRHMELPSPEAFARWRIDQPIRVQKTREVGFHFADAEAKAPASEPHGRSGEFSVIEDGQSKPYAQSQQREAIELRLGQAEEWTLSADNGKHPFHIHVNPFQVIDPDPTHTDVNGRPRWIWRDTLLLDAARGPQKIRLEPTDYVGRALMHCHILDHEDQGMMKEIDIAGPNGEKAPDTFFLRPPPAAQQVQLPPEFAGSPGKRQVLVVYVGVACPHCAAALRGLAAMSARLERAQVVAVSAMPVPDNAAKLLGLGSDTAVRLYPTVPDKDMFTRLGVVADDGRVSHAVLVFDETGREAFRYVDDQPLPELDEIPRALARMPQASN